MHNGNPTPFPLSCAIGASPASGQPGIDVPAPLAEFWRFAGTARLFEDTAYGQWGLVLFSPEEATERTRAFRRERLLDYVSGDLIIGEFLGDSDLLLIRCDDEDDDYGHLLAALPIDTRENWFHAAGDFEVFLDKYEKAEGAKYWENA